MLVTLQPCSSVVTFSERTFAVPPQNKMGHKYFFRRHLLHASSCSLALHTSLPARSAGLYQGWRPRHDVHMLARTAFGRLYFLIRSTLDFHTPLVLPFEGRDADPCVDSRVFAALYTVAASHMVHWGYLSVDLCLRAREFFHYLDLDVDFGRVSKFSYDLGLDLGFDAAVLTGDLDLDLGFVAAVLIAVFSLAGVRDAVQVPEVLLPRPRPRCGLW